jgi:hypothetical protein
MKINKSIIDYIRNVIKVAKIAGIDSAVFEKDLVRGLDENKTVFILHKDDVPEFPFDGMGLGRLDLFSSRYALVDGRPDVSIEGEISTKDGTNQVTQLTFKAKNLKVDYRCANATIFKSPKNVKNPMIYQFSINQDAVETLVKAQSAMGVEHLTLISNADGMRFELVDTNNDVFSHDFSAQAISIEEREDAMFVHRYPVKTLIALFKQDPEQTVELNLSGIMKVRILGVDVYVFPAI